MVKRGNKNHVFRSVYICQFNISYYNIETRTQSRKQYIREHLLEWHHCDEKKKSETLRAVENLQKGTRYRCINKYMQTFIEDQRPNPLENVIRFW